MICGCCCRACRPRYKTLVDDIFPHNPQDGLVRSNMEKLTFYVLSSPEKLDRIGEYLENKMKRDISRRRLNNVHTAMEALDQLLVACHAQTLNLFVDSVLRMVQKLLECEEVTLQELATNSFVKFSNIEEDTASYHRRYDFFVSKFSSMCHNDSDDVAIKIRLRLAGLRGLQGIVRKTVSDDLQVNIWEQSHMDKIVPSLLYNMQDVLPASKTNVDQGPAGLAESCLRDLVCRAAYANLASVIKPALRHLDLHNLWVPNDFAVRCFKIIMYSVHEQYSLMAIEMLQKHLDSHLTDSSRMKTSIVNVLSEVISIAATDSIGPSVLEFFNTMLRHLRKSIATKSKNSEEDQYEKAFQDCIIITMGDFASNLKDYQKIDIMMFIMQHVPQVTSNATDGQLSTEDSLRRLLLLRSILRVATQYKTVQMVSAFQSPLLNPLLKLSIVEDAVIRDITHKIIQTLLDRNGNLSKLQREPSALHDMLDAEQLELQLPSDISKQDVIFLKKNGGLMFSHLYESLMAPSNSVENLVTVHTTLVLLCVEFVSGKHDILVELTSFALAIQEQVVESSSWLSSPNRCRLHAVVASFLNFLSKHSAIAMFSAHIIEIINQRLELSEDLLPSHLSSSSLQYPNSKVESAVLFDKQVIGDALKAASFDTSRLHQTFLQKTLDSEHRSRSGSDIRSLSQIEIDSIGSSPGVSRRTAAHSSGPVERVTFHALKALLDKDSPVVRQQVLAQAHNRRQLTEKFRTAPFEELVMQTSENSNKLQDCLHRVFSKMSAHAEDERNYDETDSKKINQARGKSIFEIDFPDLYVF